MHFCCTADALRLNCICMSKFNIYFTTERCCEMCSVWAAYTAGTLRMLQWIYSVHCMALQSGLPSQISLYIEYTLELFLFPNWSRVRSLEATGSVDESDLRLPQGHVNSCTYKLPLHVQHASSFIVSIHIVNPLQDCHKMPWRRVGFPLAYSCRISDGRRRHLGI